MILTIETVIRIAVFWKKKLNIKKLNKNKKKSILNENQIKPVNLILESLILVMVFIASFSIINKLRHFLNIMYCQNFSC